MALTAEQRLMHIIAGLEDDLTQERLAHRQTTAEYEAENYSNLRRIDQLAAELAHLRCVTLAAYRAVDSALLSRRPSAATWREQCRAVMAWVDWANKNGVEIDGENDVTIEFECAAPDS